MKGQPEVGWWVGVAVGGTLSYHPSLAWCVNLVITYRIVVIFQWPGKIFIDDKKKFDCLCYTSLHSMCYMYGNCNCTCIKLSWVNIISAIQYVYVCVMFVLCAN